MIILHTMEKNKKVITINSAQAFELSTGFYKVTASDDFKALLKILNIDFNKDIVRFEELNQLGKTWCTTK